MADQRHPLLQGPQNTRTHIGDLWTTSGTLLASATFTNETTSVWQQVNFPTPEGYSVNANYFANPHTNGPPTAPSSGGNEVYAYGSSNLFPNNTFSASNYWVDVVFNPQLAG
jgi:Domain of unknown function (DUF4082)